MILLPLTKTLKGREPKNRYMKKPDVSGLNHVWVPAGNKNQPRSHKHLAFKTTFPYRKKIWILKIRGPKSGPLKLRLFKQQHPPPPPSAAPSPPTPIPHSHGNSTVCKFISAVSLPSSCTPTAANSMVTAASADSSPPYRSPAAAPQQLQIAW